MIVIVNKCKKFDVYGLPIGYEFLVSHGVDTNTGELIILPNIPPHELGCEFDINLGEYILE